MRLRNRQFAMDKKGYLFKEISFFYTFVLDFGLYFFDKYS